MIRKFLLFVILNVVPVSGNAANDPWEPTIGGIIGDNLSQAVENAYVARTSVNKFENRIEAVRKAYWRCKLVCPGKDKIENEFARLLFNKDFFYASLDIVGSMDDRGSAFKDSPLSVFTRRIIGLPDGGLQCGRLHTEWSDCLKREGFPFKPKPDIFKMCAPTYAPYKKCRDAYEYSRIPGMLNKFALPEATLAGTALKRSSRNRVRYALLGSEYQVPSQSRSSVIRDYDTLKANGQNFISCVYGPQNRDGTGWTTYQFWYRNVPFSRRYLSNRAKNHPFLSVPEVAVENCPKGKQNAEAVSRKYSKQPGPKSVFDFGTPTPINILEADSPLSASKTLRRR